MFYNCKQGMYGLCCWIDVQYHDQRGHLYNLYNMSSRDPRLCCMYYYAKQSLYILCSGIHVQQHHERSNLYHVCSSLYCRIHLSIHRLYCVYKSCLYSVYGMRSRKVSINNVYRLSEHRLSILCRWIDL